MGLGIMTTRAISAVELCVSSRPLNSVSSLLRSTSYSLDRAVALNEPAQVQLHLPTHESSLPLNLAMPRFRQVSVFSDIPPLNGDTLGPTGTVQIGQVGHRPAGYDALAGQGVSSSDSLGITTLRMPSDQSTADFSERVLGMELLAVMAVHAPAEGQIELYFYGFRRPIQDPSSYDMLEFEHLGMPRTSSVTTFDRAPHLTEIGLGPEELSFFASRVCDASVEQAPIDLRTAAISATATENAIAPRTRNEICGLGVFGRPLGG